jgi:hypothetical protein
VAVIRDSFTRANSTAKAAYARNAGAYLRKLRTLDDGIAGVCDAFLPRNASWSPTMTRSATSRAATASPWSAP